MKIRGLFLCSHRPQPRGASRLLVFLAVRWLSFGHRMWRGSNRPSLGYACPGRTVGVEQGAGFDVEHPNSAARAGLHANSGYDRITAREGCRSSDVGCNRDVFSQGNPWPCTSRDLIYMPSHQGLGLIELSVAEGAVKRTAKTVLFNNNYVLWNVHQQEFYVVGINGDAVAVISAATFTQTATMKGDVGLEHLFHCSIPGWTESLPCLLRRFSTDTADRRIRYGVAESSCNTGDLWRRKRGLPGAEPGW